MICDDPDAPSGDWIHWVIFNVPAASGLVSEGLPHGEVLPSGVLQGVNDFGNIGYDGPAPPSGTHRYYFRVFALDARLDTKPGATAGELYAAMEGHVLAKGSIMGRYKSKLTARTGL
jgi:Raf kinase inhibitor-like YbhB/YbcL family protein